MGYGMSSGFPLPMGQGGAMLMPSPENVLTFWIKMVHSGAFCTLFFLPRDAYHATYRLSLVPPIFFSLVLCKFNKLK